MKKLLLIIVVLTSNFGFSQNVQTLIFDSLIFDIGDSTIYNSKFNKAFFISSEKDTELTIYSNGNYSISLLFKSSNYIQGLKDFYRSYLTRIFLNTYKNKINIFKISQSTISDSCGVLYEIYSSVYPNSKLKRFKETFISNDSIFKPHLTINYGTPDTAKILYGIAFRMKTIYYAPVDTSNINLQFRNGIWIQYSKKMRVEMPFFNDKLNGNVKIFYKDGSRKEIPFKENKQIGNSKYFNHKGVEKLFMGIFKPKIIPECITQCGELMEYEVIKTIEIL